MTQIPESSQNLESTLKELINRYSVFEILVALKHLCIIADVNHPDFDWKNDAECDSFSLNRDNWGTTGSGK